MQLYAESQFGGLVDLHACMDTENFSSTGLPIGSKYYSRSVKINHRYLIPLRAQVVLYLVLILPPCRPLDYIARGVSVVTFTDVIHVATSI